MKTGVKALKTPSQARKGQRITKKLPFQKIEAGYGSLRDRVMERTSSGRELHPL
jgi:hypothetical protein